MSQEFETAALASAGALKGSSGSDEGNENGQACRNCGEPVTRKFCGTCGQLAQNYHRPIGSIIAEVLSDFFSIDGRVARTLPALFLNPGSVTKSYLDGKRQRYVPPFRLYLLASFVFFLTLFSYGDAKGWFDFRVNLNRDDIAAMAAAQTEDDNALVIPNENAIGTEAQASAPGGVTGPDVETDAEEGSDLTRIIDDTGHIDREFIKKQLRDDQEPGDITVDIDGLVDGGADILENQALFFAALRNWTPRLAMALTPAIMMTLILVFPFRRGIFLYDHVITTLHFQTWFYLLMTIVFGLVWIGQGWAVWLAIIAVPVYLYRLMRKVYGAGRFFGLIRTFFILFMLMIIFVLWLILLVVFSAGETSEMSRQLLQN